jgi:RNA polymerase sigma-70 factor (ECF subfamily)
MEAEHGPDIKRQLAERYRHASAQERRQTFRELYERYAGELHGYLRRMTQSVDLADDLTQDAFLRALTKMDTFTGNSSFKTWVYRIAMNLYRDHLRRKTTVQACLDDAASEQPTPEDAAERSDEARRVRAALDGLPESLRAPVVLVRLEGMKYREAARVLGVSQAALRMRIYRGQMALLEALKE